MVWKTDNLFMASAIYMDVQQDCKKSDRNDTADLHIITSVCFSV